MKAVVQIGLALQCLATVCVCGCAAPVSGTVAAHQAPPGASGLLQDHRQVAPDRPAVTAADYAGRRKERQGVFDPAQQIIRQRFAAEAGRVAAGVDLPVVSVPHLKPSGHGDRNQSLANQVAAWAENPYVKVVRTVGPFALTLLLQ